MLEGAFFCTWIHLIVLGCRKFTQQNQAPKKLTRKQKNPRKAKPKHERKRRALSHARIFYGTTQIFSEPDFVIVHSARMTARAVRCCKNSARKDLISQPGRALNFFRIGAGCTDTHTHVTSDTVRALSILKKIKGKALTGD